MDIFRLGIHPYLFYYTCKNIFSMDARFYPILPSEVFFSWNGLPTTKQAISMQRQIQYYKNSKSNGTKTKSPDIVSSLRSYGLEFSSVTFTRKVTWRKLCYCDLQSDLRKSYTAVLVAGTRLYLRRVIRLGHYFLLFFSKLVVIKGVK